MQAIQDPGQLEDLLEDPAGLTGLITTPEQRPVLDAIQAFMAIMEGYADYLMDRAAGAMLPDLPRLREAMTRRRAEPDQGEQILNRLLGLELKHEQYRMGSAFCAEIVRRWGDEALEELWVGADRLPRLSELGDPVAWAARVLLPEL